MPGNGPPKGRRLGLSLGYVSFVHDLRLRCTCSHPGLFSFPRPNPPPTAQPRHLFFKALSLGGFLFLPCIEISVYSTVLVSLLFLSLHFPLRASPLRVTTCVFGGYHVLPAISTPLEEDRRARSQEGPSQKTGSLG